MGMIEVVKNWLRGGALEAMARRGGFGEEVKLRYLELDAAKAAAEAASEAASKAAAEVVAKAVAEAAAYERLCEVAEAVHMLCSF